MRNRFWIKLLIRMETIKSGGSSTFIDIEKSAATTPCNPLFIGIPERRVVAVAAEK